MRFERRGPRGRPSALSYNSYKSVIVYESLPTTILIYPTTPNPDLNHQITFLHKHTQYPQPPQKTIETYSQSSIHLKNTLILCFRPLLRVNILELGS